MAQFFQLLRTVRDYNIGNTRVLTNGTVVVAVGTKEHCQDEETKLRAADRRVAEEFPGTMAGIAAATAQYEIQPLLVQAQPVTPARR